MVSPLQVIRRDTPKDCTIWLDSLMHTMAAIIVKDSIRPAIENEISFAKNGTSYQVDSLLSSCFPGWSSVQIAVTALLIMIAYDQCMPLVDLELTKLLTYI
jgi:hypothetical protein